MTSIALSNKEVQAITGCKFILYSEIHKMRDVRELLPCTLILYQLDTIGHFCCIFKNKRGISFFDPIGHVPDDELKYRIAPAEYHDYTYLLALMVKSGVPIEYNEHAYQQNSSMVCGHWCIFRMLWPELTSDEFYDIFKPIAKKDSKVIKLYHELKYVLGII